ncbi:MAG: methylated-DNA--[protein]-cysteine S-methyltransferase [Actinomycetota bacterium]|nr:methylated-DNA--[protein]-cysteine S-methyltransferase [Actinomycetota bacterium]
MDYSTTVRSPIGVLTLTADDDALTGLHMGRRATDGRKDSERFADVISQLERYWARELQEFDVVLRPTGTPFQLRVWKALRGIPYGKTVSYGEIARRIGSPRAVRAIGRANGSNPIAIIVPCHRVIGANGTLTGYGGGLPRKETLLRLEGALPD